MADPDEVVAADGTIRAGARRDRVPAAFEPVLADAIALPGECGASLQVYGSVSAPDGCGMILFERRVDDERRDISCC